MPINHATQVIRSAFRSIRLHVPFDISPSKIKTFFIVVYLLSVVYLANGRPAAFRQAAYCFRESQIRQGRP